MHLGDGRGAEGLLQRVLKLDPHNRLAHLDLGILSAAADDAAQAVVHFREAIRLDPSRPDAHYRLGRLLLSLGREAEAEAEFAAVKNLAGKDQPVPLVNLSGRDAGGPQ